MASLTLNEDSADFIPAESADLFPLGLGALFSWCGIILYQLYHTWFPHHGSIKQRLRNGLCNLAEQPIAEPPPRPVFLLPRATSQSGGGGRGREGGVARGRGEGAETCRSPYDF